MMRFKQTVRFFYSFRILGEFVTRLKIYGGNMVFFQRQNKNHIRKMKITIEPTYEIV